MLKCETEVDCWGLKSGPTHTSSTDTHMNKRANKERASKVGMALLYTIPYCDRALAVHKRGDGWWLGSVSCILRVDARVS